MRIRIASTNTKKPVHDLSCLGGGKDVGCYNFYMKDGHWSGAFKWTSANSAEVYYKGKHVGYCKLSAVPNVGQYKYLDPAYMGMWLRRIAASNLDGEVLLEFHTGMKAIAMPHHSSIAVYLRIRESDMMASMTNPLSAEIAEHAMFYDPATTPERTLGLYDIMQNNLVRIADFVVGNIVHEIPKEAEDSLINLYMNQRTIKVNGIFRSFGELADIGMRLY